MIIVLFSSHFLPVNAKGGEQETLLELLRKKLQQLSDRWDQKIV